MAIYKENKKITKIYRDGKLIKVAYHDSKEIFSSKPPEPRANAFRFKNVSGSPNKISMWKGSDAPIVTLEKSSDSVNYEPCDIYAGIDLQPDEVVYLRGVNEIFFRDQAASNHFKSTGNVECHGTIMDLIDNGTDTTIIPPTTTFIMLFNDMKTLLTTPELPATTLSDWCYAYMFYGCTKLTQAPELPATKLTNDCYESMFYGCKSLTQAPELPATTLASYCYDSMFGYCDHLEVAPKLPATILEPYCYNNMFSYCPSLKVVPKLPATVLADRSYIMMFNSCSSLNRVEISCTKWDKNNVRWLEGVSSTGTFIKPKELVVWDGTGTQPVGSIPLNSVDGIPEGWTVEDIRPPQEVNIGTGTRYISSTVPFKNDSSNGFTQILYKQPDINVKGKITEIRFKVSLYTADTYDLGDVNIWMGHTDVSELFLGNFVTEPNIKQLVYHNSNLTVSSDGDMVIKLDTPFEYNNTQNLIISTGRTSNISPHKVNFYTYKDYSLYKDRNGDWPTADETASFTEDCPNITLIIEPSAEPVEPRANAFRIFNEGTDVSSVKLVRSNGNAPTITLEKSNDGLHFESCDIYGVGVNIEPQETVYFRGINETFALSRVDYNYFKIDGGQIKIFGSIMDLVDGGTDTLEIKHDNQFINLFKDNLTLLKGPDLPAQILKTSCYQWLFSYCNNLTECPDLPAQNTAVGCYAGMYTACDELVKGPVISAVKLENLWNMQMFVYCSKLQSVTILANTWNTEYSQEWLAQVAPVGNIDAPNLTFNDLPENASGCPTGWTLNGEARPVPVRPNAFRFKNAENKPSKLSLNREVSPSQWSSVEAPVVTLELSRNGIDYTTCDIYTGVDLAPNETIYLRGTNGAFATYDLSTVYSNYFISTSNVECHGSVMDLCDGGTDTIELKNEYQFAKLFSSMSTLLTAPELPATTLTTGCYTNMFYNCSSLTTAPELPATTLTECCYNYMFNGCTSLTTAPKLPATTLTKICYAYMFWNCSSLTTAPELPATTLAAGCYGSMFNGCTSLTTAPELPATTLAVNCYGSMFNGCTSLTTAPDLPATTLTNSCYGSMFNGCTSLTTAPDLPATTLTDSCYAYMFYDCSNINAVRVEATSWNIDGSRDWLSGVAETGNLDAPHLDGSQVPNSVDGCPEGWTMNGKPWFEPGAGTNPGGGSTLPPLGGGGLIKPDQGGGSQPGFGGGDHYEPGYGGDDTWN